MKERKKKKKKFNANKSAVLNVYILAEMCVVYGKDQTFCAEEQ